MTDWAPKVDPPAYRELYEGSLATCSPRQAEAAAIPVERIRGNVIVVGGGDDQVWPGADFARIIATRRTTHGRETTVLTHPRAGHRVILPGEQPAPGGQIMARGGSPRIRRASLAWPHILGTIGQQ